MIPNAQATRGGVRSNRYGGSKLTNWTDFDPYSSAVDRAYYRHMERVSETRELLVIAYPTHPRFIMPVDEHSIRQHLSGMPAVFTRGLKAIFLLAGSNKEEKVSKGRLSCYGCYGKECIFIHPYPRAEMTWTESRPPKPSIQQEYRRAGARLRLDSRGLHVAFDELSLRRFYLRDVLTHEIGHFVDRTKRRNKVPSEEFAHWFATEYGYKWSRERRQR
jgi:hypothetical protein